MQARRRTGVALVALLAAFALAAAAGAKKGPPAVNTAPPAIAGTPQPGAVLTASPGAWSSSQPLSFNYDWTRCKPGGKCRKIDGATTSTYAVQAGDLGWMLGVIVVAKSSAGSAKASSSPTTVVTEASAPPALGSPPVVSGAAGVGQTLIATPGSWSGTGPLGYTYLWQRCAASGASCGAIAGATSTAYVVQAVDLGSTLSVAVTASNPVGQATATSALTAVVSTAPPPPPVPAYDWSLTFGDEFSSALSPARWVTCYWWTATPCSVTDDNELELYNAADAYVENGNLRLRARQTSLTGPGGRLFGFGSGMVTTGGRQGAVPAGFAFTYGYAEARLWMPAGKGLWPAFWMLPASYVDNHEIDIVELIGDAPTRAEFHLHAGGIPTVGRVFTGPDLTTGWHTFAVDWEPASLTWYVDGVARATYTGAGIPQEPMYLLLDLAVGGDWPGAPDASTVFPAYLDADYVRVWQHPA